MEPVYKNLGKVRPTIDNNDWSIDNKYDLLTIIYDPSSNKSYISRKDVPAGVVIDNREYWLPFGIGKFVDNAIININYLDGVSQELVTYTLEEAIARISDEDKRLGVIISFYGNEASDFHTPGWCLYQFMSDDLNDWDDVNAWNSIYYNRNKNVGWFRTESELLAIYPSPHKGDYCYIGTSLISSLVYRCYENGTWVNTHELASANIGITIGGNIHISENGTWVVDDEDTGIKAVGTGVERMTYTPSQEDGGTNILQVKLTDGSQFSFPIKNGHQGNSGIVVPDLETFLAELVNNLTTDDGTKALSAAQGVVLDNKISQLGQRVGVISSSELSTIACEAGGIDVDGKENDVTFRARTTEYIIGPFKLKMKTGFAVYFADKFEMGVDGQVTKIERIQPAQPSSIFSIDNNQYVYRLVFCRWDGTTLDNSYNFVTSGTDIIDYFKGNSILVDEKLENLEETSDYLKQNVFYYEKVIPTNFINGKYISSGGGLGDLSILDVCYLPYTPGTHYKLNYPNAWSEQSVCLSYAIYSTTDINNLTGNTKIVLGEMVKNMSAGVDIDIYCTDKNAKLLCIQYNSSNIPNISMLGSKTAKDLVDKIVERPSAKYHINNDELLIAYPYGEVDILFTLRRHNANNLFDFAKISTIPANLEDISVAPQITIQEIGTDYHVAFKVRAINNADGDNKTGDVFNEYWTGGNHGYNNQGSGSTPTARQLSLDFYVDGRKVTSGSGTANQIKMVWKNRVQGYNTTKEDGSGREILQENHEMIFENGIFTSTVELIPLEDIYMVTWYGFASLMIGYPNYIFVGGANRVEYEVGQNQSSGNYNPNGVMTFGDNGKQEMFLDSMLDMGDRSMFSDLSTQGAVASGNKAYMWIIFAKNMGANYHYYVRGGWKYEP